MKTYAVMAYAIGIIFFLSFGKAEGLVLFESSLVFRVGDGSESVAVGDFDEDGIQDLAVANVWLYDLRRRLRRRPQYGPSRGLGAV